MDKRNERLIKVLEVERDSLAAMGSDEGHNAAILFLRTGEVSESPDLNPMLEAVMTDLEMVMIDYEIETT